MRNHHLFLTLKVFSATGGIEKVCRIAGKALFDMASGADVSFEVYSMHDKRQDACQNPYFPSESFNGYGGGRFSFVLGALRKGMKSRVVILSHINLVVVGWLIKLFSPSTKLYLFAHGIEVWKKPGLFKRMMAASCDRFICVSQYTASVLAPLYDAHPSKCVVLNNCLDPFLPYSRHIKTPVDLRSRYGIAPKDKVLLTLTRVSIKDRYKGYDQVMQAMIPLSARYSDIRYLIAGGYDADEKQYIEKRAQELGIGNRVILAGYIKEEEFADHFRMADLYVMPSLKEGFGIVFIEAMYFGLPVIGGNRDGTVDALGNGSMGKLVDPYDQDEITTAIESVLNAPGSSKPDAAALMRRFGYWSYQAKFEEALKIA